MRGPGPVLCVRVCAAVPRLAGSVHGALQGLGLVLEQRVFVLERGRARLQLPRRLGRIVVYGSRPSTTVRSDMVWLWRGKVVKAR